MVICDFRRYNTTFHEKGWDFYSFRNRAPQQILGVHKSEGVVYKYRKKSSKHDIKNLGKTTLNFPDS